jgi:hypothetical protein
VPTCAGHFPFSMYLDQIFIAGAWTHTHCGQLMTVAYGSDSLI